MRHPIGPLVAVVLLLTFASSALARCKQVIVVREGPRVSRFTYRDGKLVGESSWATDGRWLGPGCGTLWGLASHYGGGDPFTGSKTATGETLKDSELTAAHRSLPLGTLVRVVNRLNGRSTVVRINDRGPFFRDRVIDLSQAAAKALEIVSRGLAPVTLEVLGMATAVSSQVTRAPGRPVSSSVPRVEPVTRDPQDEPLFGGP